jgi:hypothetical protein
MSLVAPDEAQSGQRGTADDRDLNVAAQRLQLSAPNSKPIVSSVISTYQSVTDQDAEGP